MDNVEGIIIVNKPRGITSHDVVDRVRRIVNTKKVGHTGTLDPDAEGVLPVCVGGATKVVEYLVEKEKEYITTMRFGIVTDTQDISGKILDQTTDFDLNEEEVRKTINSFIGEYMQTPPIYSAVKVKGKKLYEYARSGETVKIPARKVEIRNIEIIEIAGVTATFKVVCSKGTYIRTLCHDIGKKMRIGATMESLTRIKSGIFEISDAVTLDELENLAKYNSLSAVIKDIDVVFKNYTHVKIKENAIKKLVNGNKIMLDDVTSDSVLRQEEKTYVVYKDDKIYALYRGIFEEGKYILRIEKMLVRGE